MPIIITTPVYSTSSKFWSKAATISRQWDNFDKRNASVGWLRKRKKKNSIQFFFLCQRASKQCTCWLNRISLWRMNYKTSSLCRSQVFFLFIRVKNSWKKQNKFWQQGGVVYSINYQKSSLDSVKRLKRKPWKCIAFIWYLSLHMNSLKMWLSTLVLNELLKKFFLEYSKTVQVKGSQ